MLKKLNNNKKTRLTYFLHQTGINSNSPYLFIPSWRRRIHVSQMRVEIFDERCPKMPGICYPERVLIKQINLKGRHALLNSRIVHAKMRLHVGQRSSLTMIVEPQYETKFWSGLSCTLVRNLEHGRGPHRVEKTMQLISIDAISTINVIISAFKCGYGKISLRSMNSTKNGLRKQNRLVKQDQPENSFASLLCTNRTYDARLHDTFDRLVDCFQANEVLCEQCSRPTAEVHAIGRRRNVRSRLKILHSDIDQPAMNSTRASIWLDICCAYVFFRVVCVPLGDASSCARPPAYLTRTPFSWASRNLHKFKHDSCHFPPEMTRWLVSQRFPIFKISRG